MRAVWLERHGGPDVLATITRADPEPGPGQALVQVSYASITFVETQVRAGTAPFPTPPQLPMVPGNGVGGTVVAVGPGVDEDWVSRRVVTGTGGSGGYAELVVVPAETMIGVPDGLALDAATALLADGRTAGLLVDAARLSLGDRVLVEAAAGGVGSLLVQRSTAAGATVVGAAGGARKTALVRELGAHLAVDYRRAGWEGQVREEVDHLDVVFDGVGGGVARAAFGLLGRGGRMVSYGLAGGTWTDVSAAEAQSRDVELIRAEAGPEQLRAYAVAALRDAALGRLDPVIGQRFGLDEAAAAHAAIEGRQTLGKTLLVVRP